MALMILMKLLNLYRQSKLSMKLYCRNWIIKKKSNSGHDYLDKRIALRRLNKKTS